MKVTKYTPMTASASPSLSERLLPRQKLTWAGLVLVSWMLILYWFIPEWLEVNPPAAPTAQASNGPSLRQLQQQLPRLDRQIADVLWTSARGLKVVAHEEHQLRSGGAGWRFSTLQVALPAEASLHAVALKLEQLAQGREQEISFSRLVQNEQNLLLEVRVKGVPTHQLLLQQGIPVDGSSSPETGDAPSKTSSP